MNSPHTLREVFVCLDAPTNRPPLQAFDCSPLCRSDRPPSRRATSAPQLRPTAFPGVRPPLYRLRPPAFAGVRPSAGSASGRLTAPPPPPLAGSLWSALPPSAPWVVFCLRSAPTMLKKKIAKGFAFHNFFSNKTALIQQFILFLRCK